jgi:hypothetical protein
MIHQNAVDGNTPIHIALSAGASLEKVTWMLSQARRAAQVASNSGQYPLHWSDYGLIAESIRQLLRHTTVAVSCRSIMQSRASRIFDMRIVGLTTGWEMNTKTTFLPGEMGGARFSWRVKEGQNMTNQLFSPGAINCCTDP